MKKIKLLIISLFIIFSSSTLIADDFNDWKIKFKKRAINEGISKYTVNNLIDNSKFLPDVIKYDRYQPEFYEDTKTYISKRTSSKKVKLGKIILNKAIRFGGSSIRDFKGITGKSGNFQSEFKVYDRAKKRCSRNNCFGQISRKIISNRSTFICSVCQK